MLFNIYIPFILFLSYLSPFLSHTLSLFNNHHHRSIEADTLRGHKTGTTIYHPQLEVYNVTHLSSPYFIHTLNYQR
ncbi:hypothetical protein Hanom_Chr16g01506581 [Helianthus anomalus]